MQGAEAVPKSGAAIVQKTWAERLNDQPELESDADEQLLMYIPFVAPPPFSRPQYIMNTPPYPFFAFNLSITAT